MKKILKAIWQGFVPIICVAIGVAAFFGFIYLLSWLGDNFGKLGGLGILFAVSAVSLWICYSISWYKRH